MSSLKLLKPDFDRPDHTQVWSIPHHDFGENHDFDEDLLKHTNYVES
jgi:hypothetical protein